MPQRSRPQPAHDPTRRRALARLALGILAAAWPGASCARRNGLAASPQPGSTALADDIERLRRRIYAEEGIPMLLVCENLATTNTPPLIPQPESAALAREFARLVTIWRRLHPDRTEDDVAKILEVLADRDLQLQRSTPHP